MKRWIVRPGDGRSVGEIVRLAGADAAAIADGRVFLGRKRVQNANEPVAPGDEVSIAALVEHGGARPEVSILARDGDVVAVSKPAGIPTIPDHAGASHALVTHAARLLGVNAERVHPTSRLDRDVSGVVLVALSSDAAAHLKRARDEGTYARRYVAIASRAPSPDRGAWDAPIGRAKNPRHRAVNGRDATFARTLFATIATASNRALLAVSPITGRTHQIRVHASHAGAPLLGDRTYDGPTRVTLPTGRVLDLRRIALHAARVVVPRRSGAGLFTAEAPIPSELRDVWTALGGDAAAWDTAVQCVLEGQSSSS